MPVYGYVIISAVVILAVPVILAIGVGYLEEAMRNEGLTEMDEHDFISDEQG